jgi:septal ring factor EnvC (AmiA/AmiB activator)
MILAADSFSALVARLRFGAMLARLDGRLITQTRQQSRQVHLDQKHLQSALVGIWQAREEAALERESIESIEAERSAVLRGIAEQKRRTQSELRDLKRREGQIVQLLAELELRREQRGSGDLAAESSLVSLAGQLEWPVSGEVIRSFGRSVHPEFKTVTVNNGIYIAAPAGTPVHAVADGSIEFADDLPGFGLCIIVDHGGGYYTLYANLARVYVTSGRRVGLGEVVAEVGQSLDRSQPQLYFEIRRGRTPLDPAGWLRSPG